jgi:hypothetical protein
MTVRELAKIQAIVGVRHVGTAFFMYLVIAVGLGIRVDVPAGHHRLKSSWLRQLGRCGSQVLLLALDRQHVASSLAQA